MPFLVGGAGFDQAIYRLLSSGENVTPSLRENVTPASLE